MHIHTPEKTLVDFLERTSKQKAKFIPVKSGSTKHSTNLTPSDYRNILRLEDWSSPVREILNTLKENSNKPVNLPCPASRFAAEKLNVTLKRKTKSFRVQNVKPTGVSFGSNFVRLIKLKVA